MPDWLQRLKWVADQSPWPQFATDRDGRLLYANDPYAKLIGASGDSPIGQDFGDAVHPDDRGSLPMDWSSQWESGRSFEATVRLAEGLDGPSRLSRVQISPLRCPRGELVGGLGHATDLTEHARAEQKSREQRSLLELTDALLRVGHWHVHASTESLSWSDEVHRIHGTDPRTFHPKLEQGVDFYHPEDRPLVARGVQEALDDRKPFDFTARLVRTDGEVRTVRSVGTPLEVVHEGHTALDIVGVFQDISEEAKLLERLATSEERYVLAAAASRDGIWDWDCQTDELYWTDRFVEMLGLERSDLTGQLSDFVERLHPDDSGSTMDAVQAHFEHRAPFDTEYRMRHRDGRYLWIHAKGQASWDPDGQPLRMVGTVGDISHEVDQRQVIEEQRAILIKTTTDLRKSNDELRNFASAASHDLKEPLRKIRWFVDSVLERNPDLDTRSVRHLERVSQSAERLSSMVGELLEYAMTPVSAQNRDDVDPQAILQEVLEMLSPEVSAKKAEVEVGTLPSVHVNRAQLRQVFANLIANALKYADPNRDARIEVEASTEAGWVCFSIRDNGIGFDEKFREKIFGLFERLHGKSAYPGNGLGLALVHRIVEEHGGRAWAEGKEGVGASFFFELPEALPT